MASNLSAAANVTEDGGEVVDPGADAIWILTASFIIFTMQTGFGLLESGCVSKKNEANIMFKNVVDVVCGGITYWMFGYSLQYGSGPGTTWFCGIGGFFLDAEDEEMGITFATFIFQLSFATTATTIVSGAMAERTNFNAYILYSIFNTVTYCIPAGWQWGGHGFLYNRGYVDFAGSGAVHMLGGVAGWVATSMLKPRYQRYKEGSPPPAIGNPTNVVIGTFVLWWGWLGFNCGSTFGITGGKWHLAGRSAITTINASFSGCIVGFIASWIQGRNLNIGTIVNCLLGGLVCVTAQCAFVQPWEGAFIGVVGSFATALLMPFFNWLEYDDPVGAIAVHGGGGSLGILLVGVFLHDYELNSVTHNGLLYGGGFYLLGVQALGIVTVSMWSAFSTWLILFVVNLMIPIRMSLAEEILGADFTEHNVRHLGYDFDKMMKDLGDMGYHVHQKWCYENHPEFLRKKELKERAAKWKKNMERQVSFDETALNQMAWQDTLTIPVES